MTELFIDGINVVLPKDFSVKIKHENVFVSKNGEYTYDIKLPLTNPTNADLYRNINRVNSRLTVGHDRTAILTADNRVYCQGKEIITAYDDKTVSIQIVANNSELNYFIGDVKISELNMPVVNAVPMADYTKTYPDGLVYPDSLFCQPMVYNAAKREYANLMKCIPAKDHGTPPKIQHYVITDDEDSAGPRAQPYLIGYIAEVVKALGYKLGKNALDREEFRQLFIAQTHEPNRLNRMLPGWTVADFFSEIERLFNVAFCVDTRAGVIDIIPKQSFFSGGNTAHVTDVIDEYHADMLEDAEVEDVALSNVRYDVDGNYWNEAQLPDDIMRNAKRIDVSSKEIAHWYQFERKHEGDAPHLSDMNNRAALLWIYLHDKNMADYSALYHDKDTGEMYYLNEDNDDDKFATRVNTFVSRINRGEHLADTELKIVPCEMRLMDVEWVFSDDKGYRYGTNTEILKNDTPTISSGNVNLDEDKKKHIADAISAGYSSEQKGNIYLAFCAYERHFQFNPLYPFSYIGAGSAYMERNRKQLVYSTRIPNNTPYTLSLDTMDKLMYQKNYDIDYRNEVHFKSFDPNMYNPRHIFEIKNKRYICASIEYTIDAHGRKGAWEGVFYPIKMSDVEADAKWILEDGRWRDGGIYIDNGRWLDN